MPEQNKIKVLVVDDSFFMRKLICDILNSDQEIEIVGEAKNGIEAVELAEELEPDVITMDYNMPKMNGAEATEKIMRQRGKQPAIIIVSGFTKKEVVEALNSLRLGAIDFISKPSGEISVNIKDVGDELLEKIKIAAKARIHRYKKVRRRKERKIIKKAGAANVIVIGASTGGPPVVENIIAGIPNNLKVAILVVQHMSEFFIPGFVELLDKNVSFRVKLAEEGEVIQNGDCLVSPGGEHMLTELREESANVFNKIIHLTREPKVNGFRPSINVLMKTVAERFGERIVGVLLTGMGDDGAEGMEAIHDVGGFTIVQSPETSVVDSMPKAAVNRGAVDEILAPENIIKKIIELSR